MTDLTDHLAGLTRLARTALVPEIALHLARDATGIFAAVEAIARVGEKMPPYWAFAWPGGQATARYLLDNPEMVRAKRVVDIGSGSGIAAIAAMMAGARSSLAADIDPLAEIAAAMNARANGVEIATTTADILGAVPDDADLVLLGDLVYEPEMATRVTSLLEAAATRGIEVLVADRTSARRLRPGRLLVGNRRPKDTDRLLVGNRRPKQESHFMPVAEYDALLDPPLPAHPFERARLWRLQARPAPTPRR